jgi:hypothetical protein
MSDKETRTANRVVSLIGRSSASNVPVVIYADPVTHRLYVDAGGFSQDGIKDGDDVNADKQGVLILGTDSTHYQVISVDASGHVQTDILSIANGSINGPGAPTIDSYTHLPINLAAGANQVLVSSAANKQIWVYGVSFVVNAAGTVSFQDEDDTAVSGIMPFAANSGLGIPTSGNFAMPIWKLATNKDLEVDIVTSEVDGWLDYAIVSV